MGCHVWVALLVWAGAFRRSGIAIIVVIFRRLVLGAPLRRSLARLVAAARLIGMAELDVAVGWHWRLLS